MTFLPSGLRISAPLAYVVASPNGEMKMSPPLLPAVLVRILTGGGGSVLAAVFVAADAAGTAAATAMAVTATAPVSTPVAQVFLRIVA